MDNQINNTATESSEKLTFTLYDYESFVENGGCIYTDCFEREHHAECSNCAEY